jgi:sigma-B regulation protein RsbU (phosphoserine phosphatase)
MRGRAVLGSEASWLLSALVVMVAIGAVDVLLPSNANIAGTLVLSPFLASGGSRPSRVLLIGGVAVLLAVGLAAADGSGLGASLARILVIALGSAVAARAAAVRRRNEGRLVELTRVSKAAQETIVHAPPPVVGGVRVATFYQSSVRAATVGGDCFEVLETPFGTRVLVGDVRGHGLPSVRLAALVLGAFRALAYLNPDLGEIARELDLLTARYASPADDTSDRGPLDDVSEEFVTAVLAEIRGAHLHLVNCGHPSPLHVDSSGVVRTLDATLPSPPLGLGAGEHPQVDRVTVPAAGRLVLFTDGLIEARDQLGRFFDPEPALRELAQAPLEDLVLTLAQKVNQHAGGEVQDDVAIVALDRQLG